jgi:hypothetical protein
MLNSKFLWTIDTLLYQPGIREGFSFTILLSPALVELASKAFINQPENRARFNALAVETIISKSYKLSPSHQTFAYHEEFGVQQINHPGGGGRWLAIHFEQDSLAVGAKGDTHNIDHGTDQSLLLALWCFYVEYLGV